MILNAGLSPAWQQILAFERLATGEVNRAAESIWCASGKVLNVGRALSSLGCAGMTLSTAGGHTGRQLREEFQSDGIPAEWIKTAADTRVCTTILDRATGVTTELVEETVAITTAELESFREAFTRHSAQAEMIVISGSFPAGAPETLCGNLLNGVTAPAVLDIRGGQLLGALETGPLLVKPNREELAVTLGVAAIDDDDLPEAMRSLNRRGAKWVVVTQGAGDVWVTSTSETHRLATPQTEVVNPIGCGDCFTAGVVYGIQKGSAMIDAVRFGIAAATCNLRTSRPARLDLQDVVDCEAVIARGR